MTVREVPTAFRRFQMTMSFLEARSHAIEEHIGNAVSPSSSLKKLGFIMRFHFWNV